MDPQFNHPFADWLAVAEIARLHLAQAHPNARRGDLVADGPEPFGKRFAAVFALVAEQFDHEVIVAYKLLVCASGDAYAENLFEADSNGRLTCYTLGLFGQVLGKTIEFVPLASLGLAAATPAPRLMGGTSMGEAARTDWLGRPVDVTDSFGKHQVSTYNERAKELKKRPSFRVWPYFFVPKGSAVCCLYLYFMKKLQL